MEDPPGTIARPRERLLIALAGVALAILMTWPLATGLGRLGRTAPTDADGQFSIWNVSWVARTLVVDPLHVFDANIYAPHKRTLAYSEANLLPGVIGVAPYWLTRNPWLTLNVVLFAAFASSFAATYLLSLYLTGDRASSAAAGIAYAFCPYVMSHLSHIQLLFTGGLPLSLYMLHRLVDEFGSPDAGFRVNADATNSDRPQIGRAIALGVTLAAQGLCCAYYGVFAGLIVGYSTLVLAGTRKLWSSVNYWTTIALAAAASLVIMIPVLVPFLRVQQETGFARSVADTAKWSARWPVDYLTSPAHAHSGLLAYSRALGPYLEVLFPGFLAVGLGAAGIVIATRRPGRDREMALLYGSLGLLAFWSSLGPGAGLYRVLYYLPTFSFLRAPSRLGLVVTLCLVVFAAFAIRAIRSRAPARFRAAVGVAALAVAIADVAVFPLPWPAAPAIPAAYETLAHRTRATIAEFPFYGDRIAFPLHAQYMLFSTNHWLPMVNGYSDVIPLDFREAAPVLDSFPSHDAFAVLARRRVRYIAVHWDMYAGRQDEIRRRLEAYLPNLNALAGDDRMTIYEVLKYP